MERDVGTYCLSNQSTQAIKSNLSNYDDTGNHSPKLLLLLSNNSIWTDTRTPFSLVLRVYSSKGGDTSSPELFAERAVCCWW